jgi:predicted deacylase
MNRSFSGDPRGTISARIAYFVKTCIFPQVRVVIDIHSGGREGAFAIPMLAFILWKIAGSARKRSRSPSCSMPRL